MAAAVVVVSRAVLDVPVVVVFATLADPAAAPVIDPAVVEYRPDTVPMGVGTRTLVRLRVWGVPLRATSVVDEWRPGELMRMRSVRPARPVRVLAEHRIEALDEDRCAYTWTITCEPTLPGAGPVARLLARFLGANAVAQRDRLAAEARRRR